MRCKWQKTRKSLRTPILENVGGTDETGKARAPQSDGQTVKVTDLFLPAPQRARWPLAVGFLTASSCLVSV